jgi:hypothetical protein
MLIPLEDYRRISRVIASVLDAADARTHKACLFFAIAGAQILRDVYKIKAVPVGGAAFYRVNDETGFTIAFGELQGEQPISHEQAFHCWVIADGFAIDFMAPIFDDTVRSGGRSEKVPVRMFQKRLSDMTPTPLVMTEEGDFHLSSDLDLSAQLLDGWLARPGNGDLVEICLHWYRRPPKTIPSTLGIGSNDGEVITANLRSLVLSGAW